MSELFTFADGAYKVVGLIVAVIGALYGLIRYVSRRADDRAQSIKTDVKADIKQSSANERSRLGQVEAEVKRMDGRVTELNSRVTAGFKEADDRFHAIEKELETVARKDDLNEIKVAQAKQDSRLETLVENDRRFLGMLTGQGEAISRMSAAVMKRMTEE